METKKGISSSDAASALGSIKTERKAASSAKNVKSAQEARKAKRKKLAEIPCTCGAGWSLNKTEHKGVCPLYQAIYYREKKGLTLNE
jgi:hypothetical protein